MIRQEIVLTLFMVSDGIFIMFAYDLIMVVREFIKHAPVWIMLEDFIYWAGAAAGTFYIIYKINEGIIRGYALAGLAGGAILFQWSVGVRMVRFLVKCGQGIRKCLINLFYRCKMIWRKYV